MPSLATLAQLGITAANGIIGRGAQSNATSTLAAGGQQGIDTIAAGSQAAQKTLQNNFTATQSTLAPFINAGQKATTQIAGTAPYTPGSFTPQTFNWSLSDLSQDPAYQFRLQQGQAAINAAGNSGGTRFSGATLKDISAFNTGETAQAEQQDYQRQLDTFNTNEGNQFSAFNANEGNTAAAYKTNLGTLQNLANEGLTASGQQVSAGNSTAAGTAAIQTGSASQIAQLQTEIATAQAQGNLNQATSLTNTLNSLLSSAQQTGLLNPSTNPSGNSVPNPANQANGTNPANPNNSGPNSGTGTNTSASQPAVDANGNPITTSQSANTPQQPQTTQQYNPATGQMENVALGATGAGLVATGAGLAAAGAGTAAATGAGVGALTMAAPAGAIIGSGATAAGVGAAGAGTAAATGGIETALAAPGAASSGILGMGSLIPIAGIAVGAALIGAMVWKSTQVHPTADKWTSAVQTPFGEHLGSIVNGFDQGLANGQMTKQQAQLAYQQTASFISDTEAKAQQFAQDNGSKGKTVIDQFHQEMTKDFGPNYQGILGKMQAEIAQMPDSAQAAA